MSNQPSRCVLWFTENNLQLSDASFAFVSRLIFITLVRNFLWEDLTVRQEARQVFHRHSSLQGRRPPRLRGVDRQAEEGKEKRRRRRQNPSAQTKKKRKNTRRRLKLFPGNSKWKYDEEEQKGKRRGGDLSPGWMWVTKIVNVNKNFSNWSTNKRSARINNYI